MAIPRSCQSLLIAVLLAACTHTAEVNDGPALESVGDIVAKGQLKYAQDPNTGHCFAYTYVSIKDNASMIPIITWVPCQGESNAEH